MAASLWSQPARAAVDTQVSWPVFLAVFVVLLATALVAQLFAMHWRQWLPGAEGEKSLIGGVKSAVYTFMSNIP